MNVVLVIITALAVLSIIKIYPSIVKDWLEEGGHREKNETAFIFNGLPIFSIFFYPFGLVALELFFILIIGEVIQNGYQISLQQMVFVYTIFFLVCLMILLIETAVYFKSRE